MRQPESLSKSCFRSDRLRATVMYNGSMGVVFGMKTLFLGLKFRIKRIGYRRIEARP